MNKDKAREKIALAEQVTRQVHAGLNDVITTLSAGTTVNGYGVYRDPREVREMIERAQYALHSAQLSLASADWPTDADYDRL